jgi:hypothetical protein
MTIKGLPPEDRARRSPQPGLPGGFPEPEREYDSELDSVSGAMAMIRPGALTADQFQAMLSELQRGSEKLPDLATETFTRKSFYEDPNVDHDA